MLWNYNLAGDFDRAEVIARIIEKLLNMKPINAAHVRDPWAYFHSVIISVKHDYLQVDTKRQLEKLERGLRPDELKLLTLLARGYSMRELVAAHLGLAVSDVTRQQEGAMRERIRKILQKVRRILGPDPL